MKKSDIIRAWKDPEYRASLEGAPESPAGVVELDDVALKPVNGFGASSTDTTGCTVSGVTVNSCGYICTATTECTCHIFPVDN